MASASLVSWGVVKGPGSVATSGAQPQPFHYQFLDLEGTVLMSLKFSIYKMIKQISICRVVVGIEWDLNVYIITHCIGHVLGILEIEVIITNSLYFSP